MDYIPLENMIVETDSPYQINLGEVSIHGKWKETKLRLNENENIKLKELNEPKFIPMILESIASYKSLDIKYVSSLILSNSMKAFKLL